MLVTNPLPSFPSNTGHSHHSGIIHNISSRNPSQPLAYPVRNGLSWVAAGSPGSVRNPAAWYPPSPPAPTTMSGVESRVIVHEKQPSIVPSVCF